MTDTTTDDTTTETEVVKTSPPEADAEADAESGVSDAVDQDDSEAEEDPNPNAEAAKWRHKFKDEQTARKETQAALDDMSARVEALQRQQIDNLIVAARVKPAAVWAVTELGTLVGEDGTVDAQAVSAAIDNARKTLGIQPLGKGSYVPNVGGRPDALPKNDAFVDAFKPRRK